MGVTAGSLGKITHKASMTNRALIAQHFIMFKNITTAQTLLIIAQTLINSLLFSFINQNSITFTTTKTK